MSGVTAILEFTETDLFDREAIGEFGPEWNASQDQFTPFDDNSPPFDVSPVINQAGEITSTLAEALGTQAGNAGNQDVAEIVPSVAAAEPARAPEAEKVTPPSLVEQIADASSSASPATAASGATGPEISQKNPESASTGNFENKSPVVATAARPRHSDFSTFYEKIWDIEKQIKDQKDAVSDQCVVVARLELKVKAERKELKEATADLIKLQANLIEANEALDEAMNEERDAQRAADRLYFGDPSKPKPQGLIVADNSPSLADGNCAGQSAPAEMAAPSPPAPLPGRKTRTIIDPDPAITTDIWVLKSKQFAGGATNSQIEKLNGEDVRTIANLEEYMRMGNLVPGRVKGIGQSAVDKISDALMAWRAVNPIPQPREVEVVEPAYGSVPEILHAMGAEELLPPNSKVSSSPLTESPPAAPAAVTPIEAISALVDELEVPSEVPSDPNAPEAPNELEGEINAAYVAGCEAKVSGRPVSSNPHEKGTQLWVAWDQGWQEAGEAAE